MDHKALHIGLVSYEYPPDIGKGGIATYMEQVADILYTRGHQVEVFCGSHTRTVTEICGGVLIHRIKVNDVKDFKEKVVDTFEARHSESKFDVIESPEINANAIDIKKKYPNLPLLVKLHTPAFLVVRLNHYYTSRRVKLRFFLGGLRRGKIQFWAHYRNRKEDEDYQITKIADEIVSPSISLKHIISKTWDFELNKIKIVPNPYTPNKILLSYPIIKYCGQVVTFIGKLNEHKGIVNLVRAIPLVVKQFPNVLFRFIGEDGFCTLNNGKMSDYIDSELKSYLHNYELKGGQNYSSVLTYLGNTEICVFPSIWENFPMVCLEAMSAGCAVVGSNQGGMNEMLSEEAGILINPNKPRQIANALNLILTDQTLRNHIGTVARKKIIDQYNSNVIGMHIESSYFTAIQKSKCEL